MKPASGHQHSLDNYDPLAEGAHIERDIVLSAMRRDIRNILESYTGSYDFICEPIQNALDAIDARATAVGEGFVGKVWITIDIGRKFIAVTDNGIGFDRGKIESFLRPNVSFKSDDKPPSRGNKGVGATYLAYGFNSLEVSTRTPDFFASVILKGGRTWVEDKSRPTDPPKFKDALPSDPFFKEIEQGSSFVLRLEGPHIRPTDLGWIGARTAEQWAAVLRIKTPVGGIYLWGARPTVQVLIAVVDKDDQRTETTLRQPEYYYPHTIPGLKVAQLRDIIAAEKAASSAGRPPDKIHARFRKLNGMYETWSSADILSRATTIHPELEGSELDLVREFNIGVYGYFCHSTNVWESFNDNYLRLRPKLRILRGGLQLASNRMPQGELVLIPLTSAIGYQRTAHVIVHLDGAHPDLGRKGFQPEITSLAEKLSVAVVTTFKGRRQNLLESAGAQTLGEDQKKDEWIDAQKKHELEAPLVLDPKLMRHAPLLAIDSIPQSEQDVIALFNELLSAGVLRGYLIMATSQHSTYDGLFRVKFDTEKESAFDPETAPLGLGPGVLPPLPWRSEPKVVEYKFSIDDLIDDFDNEVKFAKHITLAVAWNLGSAWKRDFQVASLVGPDALSHRTYYGATHLFMYQNGDRAFEAVILSDVLDYLRDPKAVIERHETEFAAA